MRGLGLGSRQSAACLGRPLVQLPAGPVSACGRVSHHRFASPYAPGLPPHRAPLKPPLHTPRGAPSARPPPTRLQGRLAVVAGTAAASGRASQGPGAAARLRDSPHDLAPSAGGRPDALPQRGRPYRHAGAQWVVLAGGTGGRGSAGGIRGGGDTTRAA